MSASSGHWSSNRCASGGGQLQPAESGGYGWVDTRGAVSGQPEWHSRTTTGWYAGWSIVIGQKLTSVVRRSKSRQVVSCLGRRQRLNALILREKMDEAPLEDRGIGIALSGNSDGTVRAPRWIGAWNDGH